MLLTNAHATISSRKTSSSFTYKKVTLHKFRNTDEPSLTHRGRHFIRVRDLLPRYTGFDETFPRGFDYFRIGTVISDGQTNLKQNKSFLKLGVYSVISYGAPANQAGVGNQCARHTKDCAATCLKSAGNGSIPGVDIPRMARTRLRVLAPSAYWDTWDADYEREKRNAAKLRMRFMCRPNGTTDVLPPQLRERILAHPNDTFYDYTAVPSHLPFSESVDNYHLTLSRKETKSNHKWIQSTDPRYNIAVVCVPYIKQLLLDSGSPIFANFDEHDVRVPEFDGTHKIGLLSPKGELRGKETGFVCTTVEQILSVIR